MYAKSEDMIEEAREALNGADLALSRLSTKLAGDPTAELFRLEVVYLLEHGPSGETREYAVSYWAKPHKGMPHDKAEAAAFTYALAYFLRDLLLIPRRLQGEVSPDERPDAPAYEPRQRAEQRGWGQAAVDKAFATPAAQHGAAAVTTPFDEPNPEVLFEGLMDGIKHAPNDAALDAAYQAVNTAEGLSDADLDALAEAYRYGKVSFCATAIEFAECARKIQKNFTGAARDRLHAHYVATKARVLGEAVPPAPFTGQF